MLNAPNIQFSFQEHRGSSYIENTAYQDDEQISSQRLADYINCDDKSYPFTSFDQNFKLQNKILLNMG